MIRNRRHSVGGAVRGDVTVFLIGGHRSLLQKTRDRSTSATIKGFEVMRMIRKRQCLMPESGTAREVRFVNRLFRLAP